MVRGAANEEEREEPLTAVLLADSFSTVRPGRPLHTQTRPRLQALHSEPCRPPKHAFAAVSTC